MQYKHNIHQHHNHYISIYIITIKNDVKPQIYIQFYDDDDNQLCIFSSYTLQKSSFFYFKTP